MTNIGQKPILSSEIDSDEDTFQSITETGLFDYGTEAELFFRKGKKSRRQPLAYRRFACAADAIRFAIEGLSPDLLVGAYLQVDEERFDAHGMRRLYESVEYPLMRAATPLSSKCDGRIDVGNEP